MEYVFFFFFWMKLKKDGDRKYRTHVTSEMETMNTIITWSNSNFVVVWYPCMNITVSSKDNHSLLENADTHLL
jgi:hypothetical protein